MCMYMLIPGSDLVWFEPTEYEAQSADLEKELQDALTSRKDLESNNEGTRRYLSKGKGLFCSIVIAVAC